MKKETRKLQTIELDCSPGYPRPGDLIEGVIEDTGLTKRETSSRVFGCWMWDYGDVDEETFAKAKPIVKERIKALYDRGTIRYGSW